MHPAVAARTQCVLLPTIAPALPSCLTPFPLQVAAADPDARYALGSVLNHVLLHQTVIGGRKEAGASCHLVPTGITGYQMTDSTERNIDLCSMTAECH